jgi:hypothetical protein
MGISAGGRSRRGVVHAGVSEADPVRGRHLGDHAGVLATWPATFLCDIVGVAGRVVLVTLRL